MRIELKQRQGTEVRTVPASEAPVLNLLNLYANPSQGSQDLRECIQADAITWGNGRAAIERDAMGRPVNLYYMDPSRTTTYKQWYDDGSWAILHVYTDEMGNQLPIWDGDCLHVRGLSTDGLVGMSLISLAANSIGGGLAGEKYTNRSYKNQARPSLIIEAPPGGPLSNDNKWRDFMNGLKRDAAGLDNPDKILGLRDGITAKTLSMSGRDAQIVEQRRLSREEAALWTNCQTILGVDDGTSYNSVGEKNAAELRAQYRWHVKTLAQLDQKLLTKQRRDRGYFFEFDTFSLAKGSPQEMMTFITAGRTAGVIGQKEARRMLNLGPMDPSDEYGNPNTSSPTEQAPQEATDSTETPSEDSETEDTNAWVRRTLNREVALLEANAKNLMRDIDELYSDHGFKLSADLALRGGTAKQAKRWVTDSMTDVLEMLGTVQSGQELAGIRKLGEDWQATRADQITAALTRGTNGRR
jgi:HK97 family phage portal protein